MQLENSLLYVTTKLKQFKTVIMYLLKIAKLYFLKSCILKRGVKNCQCEKSCNVKGDGQEMAVMVG